MPAVAVDAVTKRWIRCPADEVAASHGYRMDEERGEFVCQWIEDYCVLYEGEMAGQPLRLEDWQYDATMRLFGWVRHSEEWGREIRRFRRASIWIAKKNGKSPTLAAWGLYLLIGDGEPGQKVYSVAKDGKQAMISHQHAIEMVKRSPLLMADCKIHAATGQITHMPTSSVYKVVAGDNPQSQEGLNGSVLVDETHVVDRRLMKILRGAGISRSEPLQIEVSTAGNNPDGYGKEQWDRGRRIEKAEPGWDDDRVLFIGYAAPQDLSQEDLEKDPVRYGKMANPAWGRLVKESEFVAEYHSAKKSLPDLLDFMMYRLNIWQRSANPWLRAADWDRCRYSFTENDFTGQDCWAGLDLSRTRDLSSLVLIFRGKGEEEFFQVPYFWLPEKRADELDKLIPFREWARLGHVTITPGSVIDYGWIKGLFREKARKFQIRGLAYDPKFAEEVTQTLEQGETDDQGKTLVEGTGVERVVFDQNHNNFAAPTADYERLVIAGKLHHNGHPVLTWQAGHAEVHQGFNRIKRVVKPKKDDPRTVDGIVAGIMGLALAMQAKPAGPWAFFV